VKPGDAERLRKNAERNAEIMERMVKEGYDVVSPIPTCTLMLPRPTTPWSTC